MQIERQQWCRALVAAAVSSKVNSHSEAVGTLQVGGLVEVLRSAQDGAGSLRMLLHDGGRGAWGAKPAR